MSLGRKFVLESIGERPHRIIGNRVGSVRKQKIRLGIEL